jgi:hypothetical protein
LVLRRESSPFGKALVRNGKERTFATLGLAWRVARLDAAPQSLAQPRFPDKRFRRRKAFGCGSSHAYVRLIRDGERWPISKELAGPGSFRLAKTAKPRHLRRLARGRRCATSHPRHGRHRTSVRRYRSGESRRNRRAHPTEKRPDKTTRGPGLLFDSLVATYSLLARAVYTRCPVAWSKSPRWPRAWRRNACILPSKRCVRLHARINTLHISRVSRPRDWKHALEG